MKKGFEQKSKQKKAIQWQAALSLMALPAAAFMGAQVSNAHAIEVKTKGGTTLYTAAGKASKVKKHSGYVGIDSMIIEKAAPKPVPDSMPKK